MVKGVIKELKKLYGRKNTEKRVVVLIAERVKPRIVKIGHALKKRKYKVIFFLKKENRSELRRAETSFYSKVHFFNKKEDLYMKCLLFSPAMYHIFAEAVVPEWAEYLVRKKGELGKIVYDQYDVYRGIVANTFDEIAGREKYCFENADGLCCRMFESQYLKHKFHYRFKGKRILFLDYCWNYGKVPQLEVKGNSSLKFVYGGRLLAKTSVNFERYRIEVNGFEHIAKTVQANNAYFVIVPSSTCEGTAYSAYRNLRRKYSHLLIKEPMSYKRLICYEQHMDYGIDCVELEADIEVLCNKENSFNIKAKNHYYATNKYFDYLDAGIMPIYGRKGELFGNYLAHFGGAVWCTLEEMPEKMNELKMKREENRKKACKAREIFAIENQIERLIAFYKEI